MNTFYSTAILGNNYIEQVDGLHCGTYSAPTYNEL